MRIVVGCTFFLLFLKTVLCKRVSASITLEPNEVRNYIIRPEYDIEVQAENVHRGTKNLLLYVNALNASVCLSLQEGQCRADSSFTGTNVGLERYLESDDEGNGIKWYIQSTVIQEIFLALRAYEEAPVVGACSESPRNFYNPNLLIDNSNEVYNVLSFNFSTIYVSSYSDYSLKCADESIWPAITYDIYALSWNQRYKQPNPSFDASSLNSLTDVLNQSSTTELFSKGMLLTSVKRTSNRLPSIRISKRRGLDVVIAVAVSVDATNAKTSFYVSHIVQGCSVDGKSCVFLDSLWKKVVVGILAGFGFLFAHFGRRWHRINILFSGYLLGFLVSYPLFNHFTDWTVGAIVVACLAGCCLCIGLLSLGSFWRTKSNNKLSYIPLYLCASFLIVASLFFTSIGNRDVWQNESMFFGLFYGIILFLAILIFPWITELISVDLCTALVGSFVFISSLVFILMPGCVFPYLFLDAINRVSMPDSHAALSIFVSSTVDFVIFAAWPALTIVVTVINHYWSPPLNPQQRQQTQSTLPTHTSGDQITADSWPPLPPAAFVSERQPLLNREAQAAPTAPPPYYPPEDEPPPAYRP